MVFIVPASVTVPAGATFAKFTVGTSLFASTTTITATYNGVNKAAILTSVDPVVVALTCYRTRLSPVHDHLYRHSKRYCARAHSRVRTVRPTVFRSRLGHSDSSGRR